MTLRPWIIDLVGLTDIVERIDRGPRVTAAGRFHRMRIEEWGYAVLERKLIEDVPRPERCR